MTLEKDQAFINAVNVAREFVVRAVDFAEERRVFFASIRTQGVDRKLVKEIAKRYESKDPLGFSEYDEKLQQAIDKYAKSCPKPNLAQDLLRAHVRKSDIPIAVTVPPTVSPENGLATAADSAKPPDGLSAATNQGTAAEAGVPPAAVPASPAKADDAILVKPPRNPPPVFARYARYKNGAFA